MTSLHARIHRIVHRALGGSALAVAALQRVQAVDLTPLLKEHAACVAAAVGVVIAALELLPLVVGLFESDEEEGSDVQAS